MIYKFNCPVCDGSGVKFLTKFFSAPDEPIKFTTHSDKSLVQCGNCGTARRFPLEVYSKEDFEASGKSYYDGVSSDAKGKELFECSVQNHLELGQVHHYKTLKDKILIKFSDKKRWLDVGSAGAPIAFSDFDFTTIEPDSRVVEFAKKYFKSDKIKCSAIEFFDDDSFDGVCFMHSLYCIPNPISALEKAYSLLAQDGILVIAIGDFFMDSKSPFCDNKYKRIEDIFRGSTMNVYYNPYSLEYLCNKAGFELISDEVHSHVTSTFKGMDSRFFVFKKSIVKTHDNLLSKSLEYMEDRYREFFENNAQITKNTIKEINNQKSILCGDTSVLAELNAIEKLDKIFGFLDGRLEYVCRLNDITFAPTGFFENCSDANLVVCDWIDTLGVARLILDKTKCKNPFNKILIPNRLSGIDRVVDVFAAKQSYVKALN